MKTLDRQHEVLGALRDPPLDRESRWRVAVAAALVAGALVYLRSRT